MIQARPSYDAPTRYGNFLPHEERIMFDRRNGFPGPFAALVLGLAASFGWSGARARGGGGGRAPRAAHRIGLSGRPVLQYRARAAARTEPARLQCRTGRRRDGRAHPQRDPGLPGGQRAAGGRSAYDGPAGACARHRPGPDTCASHADLRGFIPDDRGYPGSAARVGLHDRARIGSAGRPDPRGDPPLRIRPRLADVG